MTHERANPSGNPAWETEGQPATPAPAPVKPRVEHQPSGWSPTAWRSRASHGEER